MRKAIFLLALLALPLSYTISQDIGKANMPGALNPVLPGYFADPTIVKFGDIYYIYATTDNEMVGSGAPTIWYSKDFRNWYNYTMEIPSLASINLRNYWAPDIMKGDDGRYYLYFGNCQAGCNIYGYVSDTPVGPWAKLHEDDKAVIPVNYPRRGFPSLDAQMFRDDDGKIYAYWGTWVHYNEGYAAGLIDRQTMDRVTEGINIPISQTLNHLRHPL
jgi:xylan 1,4-beta-xylosidase